MPDLIDRDPEFAEYRLLEQAHDQAMERLKTYWRITHHGQNMYLVCDNGDEVLCDEAQDLFNSYYQEELEKLS